MFKGRLVRGRIAILLHLLALAFAVRQSLAETSDLSLRQHVLTTWTTDQGLPQNFIHAITQTSDGFLWVGTMNGLVRFDGMRFRGFSKDGPPELQDNIGGLAPDAGDGLWVATATGLFHYTHQQFQSISLLGQKHYRVEAMARGLDGEVWVYADGKLARTRNNASSPSFRKWLTPEQYAAQFGAADQDVQTVSGWLSSSGFTVEQVARGKNWIRFSGTAGQVESAFQTEIHSYLVNGTSHYANATALSIPAALAPAVTGVVSLNNFISTPQHVTPAAVVRNQSGKLVRVARAAGTTATPSPAVPTTGSQEENYLGPADFATIYNTQPLLSSGNKPGNTASSTYWARHRW
jgi:hypothetical protein